MMKAIVLITYTVSIGIVNVTGHRSGRRTMIDMTYPINDRNMYFPKYFPINITAFTNTTRDMGPGLPRAWNIDHTFYMAEHYGTHMDAPSHITFDPDAWTVDEIPIERLVGDAVVINISQRAEQDPDTGVLVDDLIEWEEQYGQIKDGSIVIMYSGWEKRWGNETLYLGNDRRDFSDLHYPGFFPEAAEWLVNNRSIFGVGVDTVSLERGANDYLLAHTWFLSNKIYGLENMHNVAELPPSGARLFIFPIKLDGGSGGPTRIIAEIGHESSGGCSVSSILSWQIAVGLLAVVMNI